MIRVVKSGERYFRETGRLRTFWLFSFEDYFDPDNVQFGALRVFNDDVVFAGKGFALHPHEEMEIVTVVLDGEITHEDSMHNRTVVRANDVQRMSAGTGVMHSEMNEGSVPVHLYQIWILPDTPGLAPSYDQRSYDPGSWRNVLFPVASGRGVTETVTMHADATIFRSDLDKGRSLAFGGTGRRAFVYMTAGSLSINGTVLGAGDQGRIEVNDPLSMEALEDSRFVFIDLP